MLFGEISSLRIRLILWVLSELFLIRDLIKESKTCLNSLKLTPAKSFLNNRENFVGFGKVRNALREKEFENWCTLQQKGKGVILNKEFLPVNRWRRNHKGLTLSEWIDALKMVAYVAPVRAVPGRSRDGTHLRPFATSITMLSVLCCRDTEESRVYSPSRDDANIDNGDGNSVEDDEDIDKDFFIGCNDIQNKEDGYNDKLHGVNFKEGDDDEDENCNNMTNRAVTTEMMSVMLFDDNDLNNNIHDHEVFLSMMTVINIVDNGADNFNGENGDSGCNNRWPRRRL
ncbi:hypothetical protein ANN_15435 [Periplaneta americana]|uniref:Uncharacterized protein n=1 Tax=Periplaneta americana TaxID=6978 RepID=A0ABQ8SGT5_PERAM|nr:hypothetical protein ANN_15435 [Periplaneta americana]